MQSLTENLRYSVDGLRWQRQFGGGTRPPVRLDMARAAFDLCIAQKPEQTITLRLKAQMIEESKPKG